MPKRAIWASVAFSMPDWDIWALRTFDGIDKCSKMSKESASPRMLIKSWFLPCNASQDPTLDRKLNARGKRTKPCKLGFLLVRQETQLAVLGTARRAICIVQTIVFRKHFYTSVSYSKRQVSK